MPPHNSLKKSPSRLLSDLSVLVFVVVVVVVVDFLRPECTNYPSGGFGRPGGGDGPGGGFRSGRSSGKPILLPLRKNESKTKQHEQQNKTNQHEK